MSDTDKWFSTLSFGQKLSVLGYSKNWDYKTCAEMTSAELIVTIGFPPKSIDRSNPDCPVIDLQDSGSITEEMFLNKWNEISADGKEQIMLNVEPCMKQFRFNHD